ncbi:glycosyltransferase [Candidatus Parcubacteria bacterium]|nr:glycosyltransferase [Candidatus Parcubacteria bacterium]
MKLSIIIPALNEEKNLPKLLNSLKEQSFSDYEIIIADAGSKDKTAAIAKKYGCKIIAGGLPAKGRNEGAKVAQGKLFLFLDADMILHSSFLEKLIDQFEKKKLDIASCSIYPNKKVDKFFHAFYNIWAKLLEDVVPHASEVILIKREFHEIIRGFDKDIKIAEDHSYARKAARFGKFGFLLELKAGTSSRRFEKDGRAKTYVKLVLAGVYLFLLGDIKSDIFKYKFDHYSKKSKK